MQELLKILNYIQRILEQSEIKYYILKARCKPYFIWSLQRQAKTKASDLNETGIDLELMHLQLPGETFDVTKFYKVWFF